MATNIALVTGGEPTNQQVVAFKEVQSEIANMGTRLKSVLPSHIDPAKFQRVAMTAIQADPDLLGADRASLYTALTKAATDGLLPDKREGALVIANTKVRIDGRESHVRMVVWMPMVAGIVKKIRQSGQVTRMIAKAVYEKDTFDVLFGDDDRIFHKPYLDGHPGKIVGAYSIVHLQDGSISRDFMPIWRIERAKAAAKTKFVWDAWPDEMAIKTVIRHHSKLLPQSTDVEAAFERDDTQQFDLTAAMLASPQAAPVPLTGAALIAQAADDDQLPPPASPSSQAGTGDDAQTGTTGAGAVADEDPAWAGIDWPKWGSDMIRRVQACLDMGQLERLEDKQREELDYTSRKHPTIFDNVMVAVNSRRAEIELAEAAGQ